MTEQALFKVSGEIMGLKATHTSPERTFYEYIWIRQSNDVQKTLQKVSAAGELAAYISRGEVVSLYLVQSPAGPACLFAIDSGQNHAEAIDQIGQDQAKAFRSAIKWLLISVVLSLLIIGFILRPQLLVGLFVFPVFLIGLLMLGLSIRGTILLAKAPKPAGMRAFLTAQRAGG